MRRTHPFRHMASAPLDGRIVELCCRLNGKVALGYWHGRMQDWVDDNDHGLLRRALSFAIGWRPAG